MTISNKTFSNREPRQSRKGWYTSYTYRICPNCQHTIISPAGQEWACSWCERYPINLGPQESPQDSRIFNRRQADGTFQPLSKFFDDAVTKADQVKETPDSRIARRESILAAFKEEPLNKAESIALYEELAEIDQSLLFNPSEAMDTFPF